MKTKFRRLTKRILSTFLIVLSALYLNVCSNGKESVSMESTLALLGISGTTSGSSCTGKKLNLFTDPMPPESEIPVLQLGESIVLDRSAHALLNAPVWDLALGDEYQGFYIRFKRGLETDSCYEYKPLFPGYHYVKLCSNPTNGEYTCVARGFIKVEGEMNKAPSAAIAQNSHKIFMGQAATLDMSGSTDPEGDTLKFVWRMLDQPSNSVALPPQSEAAVQTFTPDVPGRYVLSGYARDGYENHLRFLDEAKSSTMATVHSRIQGNAAPTIAMDRMPAQPIAGQPIRFDATASTDPEAEVLRLHSWYIAVKRPDGVYEFFDYQEEFGPGELRVGRTLEAGTYLAGVCLFDNVARTSELPEEANSCWEEEFDVIDP
ncbi:hypothetical protein CH375_04860 [Leptospira ellisii]|uniref:Uncharacterized protein n=2 Tax=Leptospira ellisii TaxID=2023197 RepID=A0A2N0BE49_9LEPT|nr:hypothetical protein CH379_01040 [Leptospira ellisii]PKA05493.1 hypothetical protein CH375_04860 [Leptospira ellisii]